MSTQFVSKNSNYMVVLKTGIEGNRALGTHAIPGLYIKFQSGIVDVKEDAIADMLRAHPSFNVDFLEVKENEVDPFLDTREDIEPAHSIAEVKYGHTEKAVNSPRKAKLTPGLKKLVEAEALKMLPGLLKSNPEVLKEIILGLAAEMKSSENKPEDTKTPEKTSEEVVTKKGPGRPPKIQ